MIPGTLIPIVFFLCITYVIKVFLDTWVRKRMVSEGVGEDLIRSLLKEEEQRRRLGSLRWGIVLVALAIGFGIIQAAGWDTINAGVIAVLAAATGLGNLAYFTAARRMQ